MSVSQNQRVTESNSALQDQTLIRTLSPLYRLLRLPNSLLLLVGTLYVMITVHGSILPRGFGIRTW